jgi:hypothetical protein
MALKPNSRLPSENEKNKYLLIKNPEQFGNLKV